MAERFDKVQIMSIENDQDAQRIDNFLIRILKGVPKSKIYKILRKGEVRVNKKRVKPTYKIQVNDQVRIPPIRLEESDNYVPDKNKIEFLEKAVIYEDDRLLIVNKPSGIAVHGGSGLNYGLIEGLRSLRPNAPFLELVHRLDRDTSGCILIAKKRSALRHLHEQLRNNLMHKHYHALVKGTWPKRQQKVKVSLRKNQLQSGERMVFADDSGKESETRFKVLENYSFATLVEAKPITGRTHQIRVHCQFVNNNIANDSKYGDLEFDKKIKSLGCKRLFLHAQKISFIHPKTEEQVSFEAPYDKSLTHLLDQLR